jgi:hypothetical protein
MISTNNEYEVYDVGQLIDLTEKYGLIDAKQRIYNITQSIISGCARPCDAFEEINAISFEVQDVIAELNKPVDEEQLQLLNPLFDVES